MAAGSWSEGELVRRCREGRPEAWREMIRRFTPLAYRLSARMLGAGPEAEDAVQETFTGVHRSFATFDAQRSLAAWISTIAYHAALRRVGRAARPGGAAADPDAAAELRDEAEPGPEQRTAARETGALLDEALDRLAAQDRALLALRYREGLSDSEVAEALGMPVGTVKTRLFRAREKLRQWLAPAFEE